MKAPIIHPYAEVCGLSEKALDRMGFRFSSIHLSRTAENWLALQVDWRATKDEHLVKYPSDGGSGSSSGGGKESQFIELEFAQVPAPYRGQGDYGRDHKANINIGIAIRTGRRLNPPSLGYRYQFYDRTKYGVCVWFSPKGWAQGDDTTLFSWRERRKET